MVVTQERKTIMSKKAARRVSVGIRKNIPFKTSEVVTRTQVVRKGKKGVVTKSTKVIVPIVPSGPSQPLDPSLPSPSDQEAPPIPSKPARKTPSRSAAVKLPLLLFPFTN